MLFDIVVSSLIKHRNKVIDIIILMSFFLCTGRNKKKYHKFALVDVFRESVKPKSKK